MPDPMVASHGLVLVASACCSAIYWRSKLRRTHSRQQLPHEIGHDALLFVESGCGEPNGLLQPLYLRLACNDRTALLALALQTIVKIFSSADVMTFYKHKGYTGTTKMASGRGQKGMEGGGKGERLRRGHRTHRESSLPFLCRGPCLG